MIFLTKVNRWCFMCLKLIAKSKSLQAIIYCVILLKYLPPLIIAIKELIK